MDKRLLETISSLKSYLESLRDMGIDAIPSAAEPRGDTLPTSTRATRRYVTLEDVRAELGNCTRCKLHRTRRTIVFGEGNSKARLMLIGEGPGYDEDIQGKPFVGRAGQLLTKILEAIQLRREEVYIANIVKCRPPQNRNPEPDEIECCHPFLLKQIRAIRPQVICALGTFAAQTLLRTNEKITSLRGRFFDFNGIKLIPTFHPAFLLRNPERKREVWEDVKQIAQWLRDHEPAG